MATRKSLWDSQATRKSIVATRKSIVATRKSTVGLTGYKKGIPRSIGYKGDPTWELPVRLDRNPVLVKLPVRLNEKHS